MKIFTPGQQFDSGDIKAVRLAKSHPHIDHLARVLVTLTNDLILTFYEKDALSVIDQFLTAGYYNESEHQQVRSLMQSYQLVDTISDGT